MTRETTALIGAACGLGPAPLFLVWRLWPRPRATAPATPGPVVQEYRYCPTEMRTRAAVVHGDGSATCADCRSHIPARGATDA